MRDAILTLYHDDPVSDRQHRRSAPADEIRTARVDLSIETAILDQIDARLAVFWTDATPRRVSG
jgi:hypothetical protein